MHKIMVVIIGVFLLALESCKLTTPTVQYSVSGRLLKDCSMEPIANYNISIYSTENPGITPQTRQFAGKTDDDGYFTIVYENGEGIQDYVDLADNIGQSFLVSIPVKGDKELGDVMKKRTAEIVVKLSTPQPYTSEDTLIFGMATRELDDYPIKISGPFTDGIIHKDILQLNIMTGGEFYGGTPHTTYGWGINAPLTASLPNEGVIEPDIVEQILSLFPFHKAPWIIQPYPFDVVIGTQANYGGTGRSINNRGHTNIRNDELNILLSCAGQSD